MKPRKTLLNIWAWHRPTTKGGFCVGKWSDEQGWKKIKNYKKLS